MEIFIRIILTYLAVGLVLFFATRESKAHPSANVIKLPKVFFWVGIACLVFLLTVLIALIIDRQGDPLEWKITVAINAVFLILPIYIIAACLNWKIEILDRQFLYRTFLRRTYEYELKEAWIKKNNSNIIIVVVKKKRLYINPYAVGVDDFINKIKRNKRPV